MKTYLVNYANEIFYKKQQKLNRSALKFGVDKVFSYNDKILKETSFYENNKKILDQEKAPGSGFCLWKPYIINEAMKKINEGDILFYVDSGVEIISDVQPLIDLCKNQRGILLFNGMTIMRYCIKRDCFIKMDCDNKKYWNSSYCAGGYQIYIKNGRAMQFLEEDLKYAQIPGLIDDSLSESQNFTGFKRHNYDQAVLSILAVKYGVKLFRSPAQGGNHLKKKELRQKGEWLMYPYTYSNTPDEESDYPTIFYNRRDVGLVRLLLIKFHSKLPVKLKLLMRNILR